MKQKWIMLFIVWMSICCLSPLSTADSNADAYIIGPGDVIEISVWKNEALTRMVTVLPDGKLSFPLIGDHVAAGKTVTQLRGELEKKISRYMPDPVLSVVIHQVNSMLVYVLGKVNRPGRLALNTDINVMQALSMAGGLSTYAKTNKIKIFRERNDAPLVFEFKYDDVAQGKSMHQNITLKRGDVIVVP